MRARYAGRRAESAPDVSQDEDDGVDTRKRKKAPERESGSRVDLNFNVKLPSTVKPRRKAVHKPSKLGIVPKPSVAQQSSVAEHDKQAEGPHKATPKVKFLFFLLFFIPLSLFLVHQVFGTPSLCRIS
ncbi:MAG: hypothetical protein QG610_2304 [Euryarchaeota archaeon]|nr:hypothetical protein [Euryarchaeota archaeon]